MTSKTIIGMNVDDTVIANSLDDIPVDNLGFPFSGDKKIVFASFSDSTIKTYTDYNRVFNKANQIPLNMPSFEETYPDSSGLGVGHGLKFNVASLVIRTSKKISAIRVKPECSLSVSVSSGLHDIPSFIGTTITGIGGTSEFQFLNHATNFLILEHTGKLSLFEIELFSTIDSNIDHQFAVFPVITDTRKSLPYLVSALNQLSVQRKGGLQNVSASLHTIEISKSFETTRIVSLPVRNLPLESVYLEEISLYDHILKDANFIFPLLSAIERNCIKHRSKTQDAIAAINRTDADKIQNLECIINTEIINGTFLLNGITPPSQIDLIAGAKYTFSPETVEVNGAEVLEITLGEGETAIFGKNGLQLGTFNSIKKIPQEKYAIPSAFMSNSSLGDLLTDMSDLSTLLTSTFEKTPNSGNVVSHACFIDQKGDVLTVEESLFLPGSIQSISVYCSDSGPATSNVTILLDGNVVTELSLSSQRAVTTTIKLPTSQGVHALSTNNGSNVLFRITQKSVVHAPVHPKYYTSGQLELDTLSSANIEFVAQHNNFDLLQNHEIQVHSDTSLISIDDITFNNFSCINALFCRKKSVDLKNPEFDFDLLGSKWDFCSDHPWLACLDTQNGAAIINHEIDFNNFTILWYPTTLTNLTLIQGKTCLFIEDNKLKLYNNEFNYQCDTADILENKWNHLAFTNEIFVINGLYQETERNPQGSQNHDFRIIQSRTIIGTSSPIDLTPIVQNTPVNLPDYAHARLHECEVELNSTVYPTQFQMTTVDGSVLTWQNLNNSQRYSLSHNEQSPLVVSEISTCNLPSSVSLKLIFVSTGYIRNLCNYSSSIPAVVIETGRKNHDSVIDFQRKIVEAVCTNQELGIVKAEHYTQTNTSPTNNNVIDPFVQSSFYVTPPSLILLATSQSAPYSTNQSILLLFNRKIETFPKDDSTLFTISGTDGSITLIKARNVTLLSSQISIANQHLSLLPSTTYNINLAAGKLLHVNGRVPNLEGNVSFSTL